MAQNMICMDSQDQSVQFGNFMWSDSATAECLEFRPNDLPQIFIGVHHGYQRLSDPFSHRREFEILDVIICRGSHEVMHHWHFSEQLAPQLADNGGCIIRARPGVVDLSAAGSAAAIRAPPRQRLAAGWLDVAANWPQNGGRDASLDEHDRRRGGTAHSNHV